MNIERYVEQILCVPVTRIGFKFIVEAMELILDTKDIKFYRRLSEIHNTSPRYIEKAIRDARCIGLMSMDEGIRLGIFGEDAPTNGEYIIKATNDFRRTYANKRT